MLPKNSFCRKGFFLQKNNPLKVVVVQIVGAINNKN
jgi:hypothetical protein